MDIDEMFGGFDGPKEQIPSSCKPKVGEKRGAKVPVETLEKQAN